MRSVPLLCQLAPVTQAKSTAGAVTGNIANIIRKMGTVPVMDNMEITGQVHGATLVFSNYIRLRLNYGPKAVSLKNAVNVEEAVCPILFGNVPLARVLITAAHRVTSCKLKCLNVGVLAALTQNAVYRIVFITTVWRTFQMLMVLDAIRESVRMTNVVWTQPVKITGVLAALRDNIPRPTHSYKFADHLDVMQLLAVKDCAVATHVLPDGRGTATRTLFDARVVGVRMRNVAGNRAQALTAEAYINQQMLQTWNAQHLVAQRHIAADENAVLPFAIRQAA